MEGQIVEKVDLETGAVKSRTTTIFKKRGESLLALFNQVFQGITRSGTSARFGQIDTSEEANSGNRI